MKLYNLILLFAIVVGMTSCDPDYAVEDYFDLEELAGYVAFDADGNSATISDVETNEGVASVSLAIENPTGSQSDITVNYALSGSAVYGTDYTIDGATSAGGSVTIRPGSGAVTQTNRASIVVSLLTDDVLDGTKTIDITLTSASNGAGDVAVGRGGTDFLKVATINIADIDPGSIGGTVTVRDTMLNDTMGIDTLFTGVMGVEISLYASTDPGTVMAVDSTDEDGVYGFSALAPGNYTVKQTQPDGHISISDFDVSVDPDGDADGDDSALGPNNEIPVTVAPGGEADGGNDFVEEAS